MNVGGSRGFEPDPENNPKDRSIFWSPEFWSLLYKEDVDQLEMVRRRTTKMGNLSYEEKAERGPGSDLVNHTPYLDFEDCKRKIVCQRKHFKYKMFNNRDSGIKCTLSNLDYDTKPSVAVLDAPSRPDSPGGADLCLTQNNIYGPDHLPRLTLDLLHRQELD
ncbi:hypothetical protein HGM15179_000791 [Zosterops borbonicus]|uniref:Uncharacterized protein n=1 Tax=Zosterops borbonicus TaxID=364589 RepID=A0A8K1LTX8_9PASS|nr:hypothetical protein HGM15179_000791 [Zosterops borbonicus]